MKKIFFIIVIFIIIITSGKVFAQATLPLTVIPARNQIEIEPGEKYSLPISFYNQSDSPISGFFKTADFIVDNNKGTPRLIENIDDTTSLKYTASKWITLSYEKATLPANEKVTIQVDINAPKDAKPGGRYVAVFFESGENPFNEKSDVKKSATTLRIASLIYIRVKGPITEKAIITRFFAPSFSEYGPIKLVFDILNRGDYHIAPKGVITLTNMFGGLVDQQILKEKNIFPDSLRNYEINLGQKWLIGKYKISLSSSYGETGQALTAETMVYVFPWRVAVVIILTLTILILFIKHLYENFIAKEKSLEERIKKEQEEIEKLKQELKKQKSY